MAITRSVRLILASLALVPLGSAPLYAQSGPPVSGTMALEATMKAIYRATNVILVETREGVVRTYRYTKDLVVHGTPTADPFEGLRQGATVVLHYQAGDTPTVVEIDRVGAEDGLVTDEGTVVRIDRKKRVIAVRFVGGRVEEFELTPQAVAEMAAGDEAALKRVRVYYTDRAGTRVVHYFTRIEPEAERR